MLRASNHKMEIQIEEICSKLNIDLSVQADALKNYEKTRKVFSLEVRHDLLVVKSLVCFPFCLLWVEIRDCKGAGG